MKINKEDKDALVMLVVLAGLITICFGITQVTKYLPLNLIALAVVLIEFVWCMPRICKKYYAVNGQDAGVIAYVPFMNIIACFKPLTAKITAVLAVIALVLYGAAWIPAAVYVKTFGEHFALNASVHFVMYAFFVFLVTEIFVGIGYCGVLHNVHRMSSVMSDGNVSLLECVYYVLMFLPVIRCGSLLSLSNLLNTLQMNGYVDTENYDEDDFYVENELEEEDEVN